MASMPEIFDRGLSCVVRRAVIIGNGAPGAEHQCIGLINALGLADNTSFFVSPFLFPKLTLSRSFFYGFDAPAYKSVQCFNQFFRPC